VREGCRTGRRRHIWTSLFDRHSGPSPGFREVKVESLIHGNTGGKPPNYVAEHIRDFVAQQAMTRWKGASSSHMSELLLEEKGFHLSAKTITRILKRRGVKNSFTHKGPKKHRRRERKKRFGEMVQIDASPFDWLCNGSMLSLHGAIDDATGKILALWLKPTECLFQLFPRPGPHDTKIRRPGDFILRCPYDLFLSQIREAFRQRET
jgi:hypothetical protein